jgi:hypothetical protein
MHTLKSVLAPDQTITQANSITSKSIKNNQNTNSPWRIELGNNKELKSADENDTNLMLLNILIAD